MPDTVFKGLGPRIKLIGNGEVYGLVPFSRDFNVDGVVCQQRDGSRDGTHRDLRRQLHVSFVSVIS